MANGMTMIMRRCITCRDYKSPRGSRKLKRGYQCAECALKQELLELADQVPPAIHPHKGDRTNCRACGLHRDNPVVHFQEVNYGYG